MIYALLSEYKGMTQIKLDEEIPLVPQDPA
jgi:hypothetical protein